MNVKLNRFDIRVDIHRFEWGENLFPVATLLIDGKNLDTQHLGFYPDDLFGRDEPLIPTRPPRRVAVYRCTCGEPGCSSLAPMIIQAGEFITWNDFQTFVGVFDSSTL